MKMVPPLRGLGLYRYGSNKAAPFGETMVTPKRMVRMVTGQNFIVTKNVVLTSAKSQVFVY